MAAGAAPGPPALFRDRRAAGQALGARLAGLGLQRPVVLGLPRGGLPVAGAVADCLETPLNFVLARRVRAPGATEMSLGAVAEGGARVLDPLLPRLLDLTRPHVASAVRRAEAHLARQSAAWRARFPLPDVRGREVVLVDDGLASGMTARAAIQALRAQGPARIVLAVPVAAPHAIRAVRPDADEVVAAATPELFCVVSMHYHSFGQVTTARAQAVLADAEPVAPAASGWASVAAPDDLPADAPSGGWQPVRVRGRGLGVSGDFWCPPEPRAAVALAAGAGDSRFSYGSRFLGRALVRAGFACLLLDGVPPGDRPHRAAPLEEGVLAAMEWLARRPETAGLSVGAWGVSAGAAALWRSGNASRELVVTPRAGLPFEERGGLDALAQRIVEWFTRVR